MNVNTVYQICQYALNIAQNGNVTPDQFNLIINQGSRSYQTFLLGELQQFQYNRPQSRIQYGQTRITRQKLTPLIYGHILNADSTGFSPYPGDYEGGDSMNSIYGHNRIVYVQQNSLSAYFKSKIDPIETNPIFLIEDRGFRFYPNVLENSVALAQAKLNYVRTVPDMVWGYTLDSDGRPVYSAAGSTDPMWMDTDMLEVICRALKLMGLNLQIPQIEAYSNYITDKGQ